MIMLPAETVSRLEEAHARVLDRLHRTAVGATFPGSVRDLPVNRKTSESPVETDDFCVVAGAAESSSQAGPHPDLGNVVDLTGQPLDVTAFEDAISASAEAEMSDRFLLDEGLEVLAAYRAIPDHQLRQSLKALVERLSQLLR